MRITRPFVLLALAALLAPRAEASRTGVWESNPPAAAVHTTTNAAGLLAPLDPAGSLESTAADAELAEPQRFDLGDVVLVESPPEERFRIGLSDVVEPPSLRGPPLIDGDPHRAFELRDPETRIGGFELLPPFRVGASPSLSLWTRQACGFSCREVVSDSRYDPWGLESGGAFTADNPENKELKRRYMAGEIQRTPQERALELATVGVGAAATAGGVGGLGAAAAWPAVSAEWAIGANWISWQWFVYSNAAKGNLDRAVEFFSDLLSPDPRATGMAHPERGAWVPGGARRRAVAKPPIEEHEVTTFEDFVKRSRIGDGLEGHEPLQHAVLRREGLATTRLSTEASKKNPVIALRRAAHAEVSAAQKALGTEKQPALEGIASNVDVLRGGVPESKLNELEKAAVEHARRLGLAPEKP